MVDATEALGHQIAQAAADRVADQQRPARTATAVAIPATTAMFVRQ